MRFFASALHPLLQSGSVRIAFAFLLLICSAAVTRAQDGAVDPNFYVVISQRNASSPPYAVASIFPQRDGKILVGGYSYFGGKGRVNLARLNFDGTAG